MRLSAPLIGGIFAFLCCVTLTMYTFEKETYLGQDRNRKENEKPDFTKYIWGIPDAEFNWCEHDHDSETFWWIAEPVNTFSALPIFVVALLGYALHAHLLLERIPRAALGCLICFMMIAVGTVLFHATLRYGPQLTDELPIYYLLILIVSTTYNKEEVKRLMRSGGAGGQKINNSVFATKTVTYALVWAALVTIGLFATLHNQSGIVHQVVRAVMSISFAFLFVSIFVLLTRSLAEVEEGIMTQKTNTTTDTSSNTKDKENKHKNNKTIQQPLQKMETVDQVNNFLVGGVLWFVISVLCWILDNGFCSLLQETLPEKYGVPYLQLHAWWHVFCGLGMYLLWLVFVFVMADFRVGVKWWCGMVPYLKEEVKHSLK